MTSKKTLVLGASPNPARYSNIAGKMLDSYGHQTVLLGIKKGKISGEEIMDIRSKPHLTGIHTVTVYMNAANQAPFEDYILGLQPARIIFNPGAENFGLAEKARGKGIEVLFSCTLVMLGDGMF